MNKVVFTLTAFVSFLFSYAANEPVAQPSNFSSFNIKAYQFDIAFDPSVAAGYIVLRSKSPVTGVPQDGVVYQKGGGIGNAKIFSVGSVTAMTIREVWASTTYYFAVFAYNGAGTSIDYKQDNPLTGTVTSSGGDYGNYYAGLSINDANFINNLTTAINAGRVFQSYNDYRTTIVPNFYERDTIGGQKAVNCEYSDELQVYTPPFSFTAINYSREHCLPKSWFTRYPQYGANIVNYQEGADYHNLFLTNLPKANVIRSNNPYGNVVTPTYSYMNGVSGDNANGITVYMPTPHIRGDAARAEFYMLICYNGLNGQWGFQELTSSDANNSDQNVLKSWALADPPDAYEIARHEYIASIQLNRNPFIDFPDLVECIDFDYLNLLPGCQTYVGLITGSKEIFIHAYPNPTSDFVTLTFENLSDATVSLTDMRGVCLKKIKIPTGNNKLTLNCTEYPSGLYTFAIQTEKNISFKKLVIQH
jgi:endonuclease I